MADRVREKERGRERKRKREREKERISKGFAALGKYFLQRLSNGLNCCSWLYDSFTICLSIRSSTRLLMETSAYILGTVTYLRVAFFPDWVPTCCLPALDLYKHSSTDPFYPPPKYKTKLLIIAPGILEFLKSPHYLGGWVFLLLTLETPSLPSDPKFLH